MPRDNQHINDFVPVRKDIPDDSPEAVIRDLLKIASCDDPSWQRGRSKFYNALMQGQRYNRAIELAIAAATEGHAEATTRANRALDAFYGVKPETTEPAAPKKGKPGGGVMRNVLGAFASRKPR